MVDPSYPIHMVPMNVVLMLGWLVACMTPLIPDVANGAHLGGLVRWRACRACRACDTKMTSGETRSAAGDSIFVSTREVLQVAMPLMISAGMFSLVLFADRTLLLWYDGESMSASMAGGNLFWVLVCLPVGIASMTGAIVSQYVGAGQEERHRPFSLASRCGCH